MTQIEELRVQEDTLVRKVRRIPAQGQVFVNKGDIVAPEKIVVRGMVPNPDIREVKIYAQLGVDPSEVQKYMLKEQGQEVKENEAIAIQRSFFWPLHNGLQVTDRRNH